MEKVLRVEDGKYVTGEVIGAEVELMKLLWENPSPTAAFAAQTIAMDLSGYDFVEIYFRQQYGDSNLVYTKCLKDVNGYLSDTLASSVAGRGTYAFQRSFSVASSGVTFNNCSFGYTGQSATTNNNYCIPVKIYGIKNKIQTIANDVATTADKCIMSSGKSVEETINVLGNSVLLATWENTAAQTITLEHSIDEFKFIEVTLSHKENNVVLASTILPVSVFKTILQMRACNTGTAGGSMREYLVYAGYVSDTSASVMATSTYTSIHSVGALYGIK